MSTSKARSSGRSSYVILIFVLNGIYSFSYVFSRRGDSPRHQSSSMSMRSSRFVSILK